jgi:hypothetical protein
VAPRTRDWIVQVSPVLVLGVSHLAARLCTPPLGAWAWLPVMLVYWAAMLAVTWAVGGLAVLVAALRRPSGAGA